LYRFSLPGWRSEQGCRGCGRRSSSRASTETARDRFHEATFRQTTFFSKKNYHPIFWRDSISRSMTLQAKTIPVYRPHRQGWPKKFWMNFRLLIFIQNLPKNMYIPM
jgi:hypothetical protein